MRGVRSPSSIAAASKRSPASAIEWRKMLMPGSLTVVPWCSSAQTDGVASSTLRYLNSSDSQAVMPGFTTLFREPLLQQEMAMNYMDRDRFGMYKNGNGEVAGPD